jgi:hypothetical protein
MAKTLTVQQGDHLSGIAADNEFATFETIWNDAKNAALKAIRDPHVLFPGDQLFIPDRLEKIEAGATTMLHVFAVVKQRLFLRLKILDLNYQPLKNAPCELKVESEDIVNATTNAKGFLTPDQEIEVKAHDAELTVHLPKPPAKKGDAPAPAPDPTQPFELKIGNLNPETKLSGQQARLNNLGYFAGYAFNDLEQLLWAAEEFACDHINNSAKRVADRPKIVAVKPEDQKDGEELGDPKAKTGIQEEPASYKGFYKTLTKEHGS